MKSILYLQQRPKNRERTCRKNFCSSCRCSRVFLVQAQCIKLACKASWNTLRDLRRRRYLTSSAASPSPTPPPGPEHSVSRSITRKGGRTGKHLEKTNKKSDLKVVEGDKDWTTTSYLWPGGQSCQLFQMKKSCVKTGTGILGKPPSLQEAGEWYQGCIWRDLGPTKFGYKCLYDISTIIDFVSRLSDRWVDVVLRGESEEVPSVPASLEVLGASPEPFRRTGGCFCCKCKSPAVLKVANTLILGTNAMGCFRAPRRGLRLQVKYMRTHSHAFVHIVHFFVEIVVDTGYWIHFSLDRLHLGFKPGLFPLSSLHCQHQWNVKQLHTILKIGHKLSFLINLQTSYRHSCHSSEKLQKNIFEAVNCDLQFLSIETNKFLFLIFPNAVKALIL